ncbi:BMC domain-containing protein [Siculibacillus lacustris]|nr:BMC domain-containing protein [Siculibacillus lacustris]
MTQALGLIEAIGYATAVVTADAVAKAANVRVLGAENAKGGGRITIKFVGDVGAVKAAVAAGVAAAERIGKIAGSLVIPRPSEEIIARALLVDFGAVVPEPAPAVAAIEPAPVVIALEPEVVVPAAESVAAPIEILPPAEEPEIVAAEPVVVAEPIVAAEPEAAAPAAEAPSAIVAAEPAPVETAAAEVPVETAPEIAAPAPEPEASAPVAEAPEPDAAASAPPPPPPAPKPAPTRPTGPRRGPGRGRR